MNINDGTDRRWCPPHRRYELCPKGTRLTCSLAWRDLYALEREIELEKVNPLALIASVLEQLSPPGELTPHPQPKPTEPWRPAPAERSRDGGVPL